MWRQQVEPPRQHGERKTGIIHSFASLLTHVQESSVWRMVTATSVEIHPCSPRPICAARALQVWFNALSQIHTITRETSTTRADAVCSMRIGTSHSAMHRAPKQANLTTATGNQITPAGNSADMTDIVFPTAGFADPLERATGSELAASHSGLSAGTLASRTAAFGSALLTLGRRIGEVTGTTMTMPVSATSTMAITCATVGIQASGVQSASRCRHRGCPCSQAGS